MPERAETGAVRSCDECEVVKRDDKGGAEEDCNVDDKDEGEGEGEDEA